MPDCWWSCLSRWPPRPVPECLRRFCGAHRETKCYLHRSSPTGSCHWALAERSRTPRSTVGPFWWHSHWMQSYREHRESWREAGRGLGSGPRPKGIGDMVGGVACWRRVAETDTVRSFLTLCRLGRWAWSPVANPRQTKRPPESLLQIQPAPMTPSGGKIMEDNVW